nr:fimbria/pilus periplasmic chaperone [Burkholderia cepacia]
MATVPPGKRQLIRLTQLAESASGTEDSYRVLIDEIPHPDDDAAQQDGHAQLGVKFQMHYSIPLFVYGQGLWTKDNPERKRGPATAAWLVLSWRLVQDGGKR